MKKNIVFSIVLMVSVLLSSTISLEGQSGGRKVYGGSSRSTSSSRSGNSLDNINKDTKSSKDGAIVARDKRKKYVEEEKEAALNRFVSRVKSSLRTAYSSLNYSSISLSLGSIDYDIKSLGSLINNWYCFTRYIKVNLKYRGLFFV